MRTMFSLKLKLKILKGSFMIQVVYLKKRHIFELFWRQVDIIYVS